MFIFLPHLLHLPLVNMYESIGIRSYHFNCFLHFSQCEGFINMSGYLYSLSILYINAFKKLASTRPKRKKYIYMIICIYPLYMNKGKENSPQRRGVSFLDNYYRLGRCCCRPGVSIPSLLHIKILCHRSYIKSTCSLLSIYNFFTNTN